MADDSAKQARREAEARRKAECAGEQEFAEEDLQKCFIP
jgi:hypothetical protein